MLVYTIEDFYSISFNFHQFCRQGICGHLPIGDRSIYNFVKVNAIFYPIFCIIRIIGQLRCGGLFSIEM